MVLAACRFWLPANLVHYNSIRQFNKILSICLVHNAECGTVVYSTFVGKAVRVKSLGFGGILRSFDGAAYVVMKQDHRGGVTCWSCGVAGTGEKKNPKAIMQYQPTSTRPFSQLLLPSCTSRICSTTDTDMLAVACRPKKLKVTREMRACTLARNELTAKETVPCTSPAAPSTG